MGEGVVPDDVPLGELAAHQVGTSLRVLADEEEGGVHAARLEQVEDARRPDGIGSVVESDGDAARRLSALALEDPTRGVLQVVLALHGAAGVPGHLPAAGLRCGLERDQLAVAGKLHVVGSIGDGPVEALARGRFVEDAGGGRAREEIEELRVLGAEPPDRGAAKPQPSHRLELRGRSRGVEEPDLVPDGRRLVVVVIIEGRRTSLRVPLDRDLVLARRLQRLDVGKLLRGPGRVAVVVQGPVVSVGSDREDDLVGGRPPQVLAGGAGDVLGRGDGPRVVARGVLVVRHDDEEVRRGGQAFDGNAARFRRNVHGDEEPARVHLAPGGLHQLRHLRP